ncbi:hypothetical protein ALC57_02321, partial [Trachymyrmex cornetzi]
LPTSEHGRFFEDPLKLGRSRFHYGKTEIPSCDKTTLGNRRQPPHDFRSVPFSFSTLSTYVQSKFSAPSLHDNDNGAKTAMAPTSAEKNEKNGRKKVEPNQGGRRGDSGEKERYSYRVWQKRGTQESRKSLIRCSRQRNSSLAESRGKGEERVKEKGGRRVAPRLDLEGELKIVSDTNVVESILSIAVAGKRTEGERSERTAPFESGMESSNSRSRYVPFRPIS